VIFRVCNGLQREGRDIYISKYRHHLWTTQKESFSRFLENDLKGENLPRRGPFLSLHPVT